MPAEIKLNCICLRVAENITTQNNFFIYKKVILF